jgi:peptide/nickel transport system permease protein
MTGYLIRRGAQAAAVLVVLTLVGYLLLRLVPGGPAGAILGQSPSQAQLDLVRQAYGLGGGPVPAQYLRWLDQLLRGNLGYSFVHHQPVAALLAFSLPRTATLTAAATLLAAIVAVPAGLLQAARRDSVTDRVLRGASYLFYGTPSFVLGIVLIAVFAVRLHLFGAEGPQAPGIAAMLTDWRDLTLPVLTLALLTVALFARYMRSSALDSLAEDYVRTARSIGAPGRRVLVRHVFRNAATPVITLAGLALPRILGGAVVVESLFNIQGMGWQIWQAALSHDYPVLLAFTLVIGAGAVAGSLLADICLAVADPRVRRAGG